VNTKNASHRSGRRLIALSAAAALALVACGGDDSADTVSTEAPMTTDGPMTTDMTTDTSAGTSAGMSSEIEITGAWARNSPAMATMGAAYMTIMSTNGDRLLAASVDSAIAAAAEVHEVVPAEGSDTSMSTGDMGSGEMVMREVEAIDVPAGEMVMLMPGGYHIMLIDLVAPLELGQTFDVVLTFETAGDVTVPVEVRDEAP
jgi:copper(I)-binding protein